MLSLSYTHTHTHHCPTHVPHLVTDFVTRACKSPTISSDWREIQPTIRPVEVSRSCVVLHAKSLSLEVSELLQTPYFPIVPLVRLHLKETTFLSCRHPRVRRIRPLHLLRLPGQAQTQRPPLCGIPYLGQQARDVFIQEGTRHPLQERQQATVLILAKVRWMLPASPPSPQLLGVRISFPWSPQMPSCAGSTPQ